MLDQSKIFKIRNLETQYYQIFNQIKILIILRINKKENILY